MELFVSLPVSKTAPFSSSPSYSHPKRGRGGEELTIAETPSIIIKMIQLRQKNAAKVTTKKIAPPIPDLASAGPMVMDHSTADSCWCASDSAHRRRYEAVWETQLRQNSMHAVSSVFCSHRRAHSHHRCRRPIRGMYPKWKGEVSGENEKKDVPIV